MLRLMNNWYLLTHLIGNSPSLLLSKTTCPCCILLWMREPTVWRDVPQPVCPTIQIYYCWLLQLFPLPSKEKSNHSNGHTFWCAPWMYQGSFVYLAPAFLVPAFLYSFPRQCFDRKFSSTNTSNYPHSYSSKPYPIFIHFHAYVLIGISLSTLPIISIVLFQSLPSASDHISWS